MSGPRLRGLRVAHLIESDGPGGAERLLATLVTHLQAAGCENVVVLPARGEGWLARELAGADVRIEYFEQTRSVSPRAAGWLTALLGRHRIAVAHSHDFSTAIYGAWAARQSGAGHVITMHGGRYYAQRLRRRIALRAAAALGSQLVAVSPELARHLSHDLWIRPSRILTIPNGVSFAAAAPSPVREELHLAATDRMALAVGNLYPVKGHGTLIEALALVTERHPQLHVAIAGRGGLADSLHERARLLGVSQRLHLLGLRSDIPGLLAAADLFVLPSLSEALPLALLEAMVAGLPIVATDVGGIAEALAHGQAGVLVRPGDAQALAEGIDHLLSSPADAQVLAARAKQRAATAYDVKVMVGQYGRLYERLVAHPAMKQH